MMNDDQTTMRVNFEDVLTFNSFLAETLQDNYYRFEPFLREGVRDFFHKHEPTYVMTDATTDQQGGGHMKDFHLSFYNLPAVHKIRDLKAGNIGRLMAVSGTVVRTSEVRPELISGSFQCLDCNNPIKGVDQQFKYTEPLMCSLPQCENRTRFQLDINESKFVDWQKVRVQENSTEIPSGSMPRSLDIVLRHEIVENAKAGDKCVFTGTLIVVPDVAQISNASGRVERARGSTMGSNNNNGGVADGVSGLKALGLRDLTYKMSFLVNGVCAADSRMGSVNIRDDKNPDEIIEEFTIAEREEIIRMKEDSHLKANLIASIAPTVFGHEDIKLGVLLMLFGGVHKTTLEDISLRGDINVCIVGDPSTSKSQFLKYVVDFLPRAVYASGKASTAAGLTAAVVKDDETKEFGIEAGALMLADNGICCIDEFDKMDIKDQVAIHEAMEQQTISIAKAGIQATLNARTSILAAANPIGGRYDKTRTMKQNVAMTAPIMSRFDLFFVVVDECNEVSDYNIARHIVNVHQLRDKAIHPPYTKTQLQRYIKFARSLKPALTQEAGRLLADQYRRLRMQDADSTKSSFRITVRQLESMVRLSEAIARMHLSDDIIPQYVKEAYQLLQKSIVHVDTENMLFGDDDDMDDFDELPRDNDGDIDMDGGNPMSTAAATQQVQISYQKYSRVGNMIATHLRALDESGYEALHEEQVIEWYLDQMADELGGTEDVQRERQVAHLIIERLIKHDSILLAVGREQLIQGDEGEEDGDDDKKLDSNPILIVHPNYVPGDDLRRQRRMP